MRDHSALRPLRRLLARRALGIVRTEEHVDWAVEALVDGLDTTALRILAGLSKPLTWSEVEHYFALTLSELALSLPDPEAAVR